MKLAESCFMGFYKAVITFLSISVSISQLYVQSAGCFKAAKL